MPPVAYFLGKVGLVGVTSVLQTVLLLVVATLFLRRRPADRPERWAVFVLVFGLGVFSGTVLGIAYSSLATSRSIGAVVIGPMLVLQFISGVYIAFDSDAHVVAAGRLLFPLKWIAQGMRSVFFPAEMAAGEMAGSWETGKTALVLLAWGIAGLILCVTTFRWFKRGTT